MVSNIFGRPFVFFIQTSSFSLKFLLMSYSVWEHTSHLNPDTQVAKGLSAGSGLAVRRKACGGLHLQVGGFSYRCFSSLTRRNLGFNISSNRNLFALFVNTVRRTVHFFHVSYPQIMPTEQVRQARPHREMLPENASEVFHQQDLDKNSAQIWESQQVP